MEPAAHIIKLLGGEAELASITGTAITAPYRWQYPRARGGTGGQIPAKYLRRIIEAAGRRGIILSPNDFFTARDASGSGALIPHPSEAAE